jgi:hypothetical protein
LVARAGILYTRRLASLTLAVAAVTAPYKRAFSAELFIDFFLSNFHEMSAIRGKALVEGQVPPECDVERHSCTKEDTTDTVSLSAFYLI